MTQIPAMEAPPPPQQDQKQQSTNDDDDNESSLLERYERAVAQLQQGEYVEAVQTLQELQESVARQSLFSFHNNNDERLDDIATSSIPLLQLEHDLALAYTQLPITTPAAGGHMIRRQGHLKRAVDLWTSFLQKMQALELLSADERKQFQELLELSEVLDNNNNNNNESWSSSFRPPPLPDRDTKIARFRLKQQAQQERQRLLALQQRRQRLGLTLPDELDGQDGEELDRNLARTRLDIAKAEALEEWASTIREWPMLARMVREQQQQPQGSSGPSPMDHRAPPSSRSSNTGQGLEVTRITQDTTTGQLQMRREQIRATVFRPGWNQPTMTLDELAEREVRAAEERAVRQNEAESMDRPRRYDQLVKDGLEDDAALVDASAQLDRQWDAFKDENPRGSGNKRGDEGDRNF